MLCTILFVRPLLLASESTPDSIRFHRLLRTRNVKIKDIFDLVELENSEGASMGYGLQDRSGQFLDKISVVHNQVEMIEEIESRIRDGKEAALSSGASDRRFQR